jgi:hypothetical protein
MFTMEIVKQVLSDLLWPQVVDIKSKSGLNFFTLFRQIIEVSMELRMKPSLYLLTE